MSWPVEWLRIVCLDCQVLKTGFNRQNLFYEIRHKSEKSANVVAAIYDLLKSDLKDQSGIIYCLSRKDCEELTKELQ